MRQPGVAGNLRRQQRRLIVPAGQKPQPVQRNRRNDQSGLKKRVCNAYHPPRHWPGQICAVSMLQRQDHAPGRVAVEQGGTPPFPGSGDGKAIVAQYRMTGVLTRQRHPAQIANQPADKGGVAPAGPAKTKVMRNGRIAGKALRRVDQMKRGLQSCLIPP